MCVCGWGDLPLSGSIYNVLTLAVSTITSVKVILRSPAHVNPLLRCLCGKVQIHCCGMDDKPVSVWLASYSKSQPGLENYILTIDLCNKTKSNDMYGHNDPCWQDGKWSVFYELLLLRRGKQACIDQLPGVIEAPGGLMLPREFVPPASGPGFMLISARYRISIWFIHHSFWMSHGLKSGISTLHIHSRSITAFLLGLWWYQYHHFFHDKNENMKRPKL